MPDDALRPRGIVAVFRFFSFADWKNVASRPQSTGMVLGLPSLPIGK